MPDTLEELTKQLEEEAEKWDTLGIHPNMVQWTNEEVFQMKCSLQAITNCIARGIIGDEEAMNIELKKVILGSMKEIREMIEPQVIEARKQMVKEQIVGGIKLPWTP